MSRLNHYLHSNPNSQHISPHRRLSNRNKRSAQKKKKKCIRTSRKESIMPIRALLHHRLSGLAGVLRALIEAMESLLSFEVFADGEAVRRRYGGYKAREDGTLSRTATGGV